MLYFIAKAYHVPFYDKKIVYDPYETGILELKASD